MKTKQQIKDQYASSLGYGNWSTAIKCLALFDATNDSIKAIDKFIDGYQELCCNEVGKATLEEASRNADVIYRGDCFGDYIVDKQSITSPDNIVLL